MTASVWYPVNYFRLSFGKQDRLGSITAALGEKSALSMDSSRSCVTQIALDHLRRGDDVGREIVSLANFVLYRFLRLFFAQTLRRAKDWEVNRHIALVLQDPLLFDTSVYENVALGLRFRGLSKQEIQPRVEAWLKRLGILHLSSRRASELSGGEGQRVSLARALVLEPELLLLDEPFSALDPPTRARLLADLGEILPESGTTTIFITHNLEEARHLAGRIAVIMDGRLQPSRAAQEILQDFPAGHW